MQHSYVLHALVRHRATLNTRKSWTYSGDLDELRQDVMQLVLRRRLRHSRYNEKVSQDQWQWTETCLSEQSGCLEQAGRFSANSQVGLYVQFRGDAGLTSA